MFSTSPHKPKTQQLIYNDVMSTKASTGCGVWNRRHVIGEQHGRSGSFYSWEAKLFGHWAALTKNEQGSASNAVSRFNVTSLQRTQDYKDNVTLGE